MTSSSPRAEDGWSHGAFVRDGRFELHDLAPGTYILQAVYWHPGGAYTAQQSVEVQPGQTRVDMPLQLTVR